MYLEKQSNGEINVIYKSGSRKCNSYRQTRCGGVALNSGHQNQTLSVGSSMRQITGAAAAAK